MKTPALTDLNLRDLPREEHDVLQSMKEVLEKHAPRVPVVRLAGLASVALQMVVGRGQRPGDRVARAVSRGVSVRQRLVEAEGGSQSSEDTARLLGISKTAVLKRFQNGKLVGWREEKQGAVRFPVWQFADGRVLPGVVEVLEALQKDRPIDEWARMLFFLQDGEPGKGTRPLDLLRAGRVQEALNAAAAYGG